MAAVLLHGPGVLPGNFRIGLQSLDELLVCARVHQAHAVPPDLVKAHHPAEAVGPGGVLAPVPDAVPLLGGVHHAVQIAVGGFDVLTLLAAQGIVQPLFKGQFCHIRYPPYRQDRSRSGWPSGP